MVKSDMLEIDIKWSFIFMDLTNGSEDVIIKIYKFVFGTINYKCPASYSAKVVNVLTQVNIHDV